jgi:hypothetical protein
LVKQEDQDWSPEVIYSILTLATSECGTSDADALEGALDLAKNSNVRGPKKIFVFTDGYGTRGRLVTKALHRAQFEGVEVVGITVGFGKSGVPAVYSNYVTACLPCFLPEALQAYSENSEHAPETMEEVPWERATLYTVETVKEALEDQKVIFPHIREKLSSYREGHLVISTGGATTTVDLAFCIDCTGSMMSYMKPVQEQVKGIFFCFTCALPSSLFLSLPPLCPPASCTFPLRAAQETYNTHIHFPLPPSLPPLALIPLGIVTNLITEIQRHYPSLTLSLRYALIPYRDVGDDPMSVLPFTSDVNQFIRHLEKLEAKGGKDEPEDVFGALATASGLSWESTARYLIWICDAPGHGSECHDNEIHDADPSPSTTVKSTVKSLVAKKINVSFCRVNEGKTKKMEKAFMVSTLLDYLHLPLRFPPFPSLPSPVLISQLTLFSSFPSPLLSNSCRPSSRKRLSKKQNSYPSQCLMNRQLSNPGKFF